MRGIRKVGSEVVETIFGAGALGAGLGSIVALILGLIEMRRARRVRRELEWIRDQYHRAGTLVESSTERDVITGLQLFEAFNDRPCDLRALEAVQRLTESRNERIARYARGTLRDIVRRLGESERDFEAESGRGTSSAGRGPIRA